MAGHYDVAVIGTQVSGLIAAALLAKRGVRVLLVDHGENASYYHRHGLRLPLVPTLMPSIEDAPHVSRVHDELGLGPELRAAVTSIDPAFQAVMPHHRIDIHPGREALLAELRREFPELAEPVNHFFARLYALDAEISAFLAKGPPLPPKGLRERLRAKAMLAHVHHLDAPFENHDLLTGIPLEHPVREMLLGPLTFFGHLAPQAPSTFHAVRLISRYFRGVLTFEDRIGGLHGLLLAAAERAGVNIHRGAIVRGIEAHGRKLTQLEIVDDREAYGADYFVDSSLGSLQDLLPAPKRLAKYAMDEQLAQPIGSLLVLNLLVKRDVIPYGMGQALFLLNGRREIRGEAPVDPPLFLRRYPAQRGELGPVRAQKPVEDLEHEVLSCACPVRTHDVARSPERLAALRDQMFERVRRVVPFLDDFIVDRSLPIETTSWDVGRERWERRIDPWSLHPIFETKARPVLGIAARPIRTAYRNLVHCGRDVVPGLGVEGEYIAGMAAAEALQAMAGRSWQRRGIGVRRV